MTKPIRIGTRGSKLALWQAKFTQAQLRAVGLEAELHIIKTKGDKLQHLSFDKIEGKGFFTKEIEEALIKGEVDLAVHSMKDLPTEHPEGLIITALSERANPADWLIIRKEKAAGGSLLSLSEKAVVGTSSARRKAQLLDFRPDLQLKDIRGNVPTRLNKLRSGDFDAILLAGAGLERLEMDISEFKVIRFDPREFVPAPAQGVLAWQTREADLETRRALKPLHQPDTTQATNIERRILQLMDGGCHLPLGAYCKVDTEGNYHVWAAMAENWDAPLKRTHQSSSTAAGLPETIVEALRNG